LFRLAILGLLYLQAPKTMTATPVNLKDRFFEDYREGEQFEFGEYLITEEEIIEFATRFDPQPFHINKAAAAETIFGGLIASGWMTASIGMRMLVDNFISVKSSMGSPGVDEMRFVKPVRPGDRLRLRLSIMSARKSQSKPDRGLLHFFQEIVNQNNEVVLSLKGWVMNQTRER
jgi:acyl dehydratase